MCSLGGICVRACQDPGIRRVFLRLPAIYAALPVSAISFEAFSIFRASFILLCSGVKRDFGHSLNLVARRLEVHMTKCLLAFALSIPLCGQCQTYADSPFYRTTTAVPTTAHVEGWEHGSIKANGV